MEVLEIVCAGKRLAPEEAAGVLARLVEKPIMLWSEVGGEQRYRLPDTALESGAQWLLGVGVEREVGRRHHDYHRLLVRRGDAEWLGPRQVEWYERMVAERAGLRAAVDFSRTQAGGGITLETVGLPEGEILLGYPTSAIGLWIYDTHPLQALRHLWEHLGRPASRLSRGV
ncbi:hypothetical protein ACGFY7_19760 [Streptomyces prunicolor]|uniref:hypothetical protein n=1 Tax=Streptomyces prunicolor TaxID=67348 RepID=UPI00371818D9